MPTTPTSLIHATNKTLNPSRFAFLLPVLYRNYAISTSNENDLHYTVPLHCLPVWAVFYGFDPYPPTCL